MSKDNNAIKIRITLVLAVCIVGVIAFCMFRHSFKQGEADKDIAQDLQIEYYGDSLNYFHVIEDWMMDGEIVMAERYYEAVPVKNSTQRFYIPIDPETYERLPSDKIQNGTRMEIDGKTYVVNVDEDSNYSLELDEEEKINE